MIKENKLILVFIAGMIITLMFATSFRPAEAETRNLSLGMMGGDVRQMKIDLSEKGYKLEPFVGFYGPKSRKTVLEFQKRNKLKATGVFDKETREALKDNQNDARAQRVPEVSRSFSRDELIMLARVVNGEARGESLQGQVAVAAVILNRTQSHQFPKTINGVVFQPGAFDAVEDGQIWMEPSEKSVKAAEMALSGYDPTGNAIYYWNPAKTTNKWIWSRPIIARIGSHVFAR